MGCPGPAKLWQDLQADIVVRSGFRGRFLNMRGITCFGLVVVLPLMASSCNRKRSAKSKSRNEPLVGKPDARGRYSYRVQLPDRYRCERDSDCWYTHLRPGNCCPDQCDPQPASRQWLDAVKAMHYPNCRPWFKQHGFGACGRQDCPPPKGYKPRPRCVNHRCTLEFQKLHLKVHWQRVTPPAVTPGARPAHGPRPSGSQSPRPAANPNRPR